MSASTNPEAKTAADTVPVDYKALLEKGMNALVRSFLEKVGFKEHVAAGYGTLRLAGSVFQKHFEGSWLSVTDVDARLKPLGVTCRLERREDDDPEVILEVIM